MTRYEQLSIKIKDCLDAAHRTTGAMSFMWFANAEILMIRRDCLTVEHAGRIVK